MSKTVIGLFDNRSEAEGVERELAENGFDRSNMYKMTDANDSKAQSFLENTRLPDNDVNFYKEGVRRGGTAVFAEVEDNRAQQAAEIMRKYNVVDVDSRMEEYRGAGVDQTAHASYLDDEGTVIPVTEEEIKVGKRQVQRGGVRIHSRVIETPVHEEVSLRNEEVHVERRKVDRPVDSTDDAFRERTIEATAMGEEAVVSKTARVVEEVMLDKDVTEQTQVVEDTVRRTEVDVEQIDGGTTTGTMGTTGTTRTASSGDYSKYESDFRDNFKKSYSGSDYTYDDYAPVYRYGTNLATNDSYRDRDWNDVEPEARKRWEERNPNTWDQFKDSIKYAWQRARS